MSYKKITLIFLLGIFLSSERKANAQITLDSFAYTGTPILWTVPCATSATVYMWGAGGGGGGGGTGCGFGAEYMNGGAGGGGACVVANIVTLVPGTVYTITIGGGGAGGLGCNGANGANGDSTVFAGQAGTWVASGGAGGTGQSNPNSNVTAVGGNGGSTGRGVNITVYAGGTGSTGYNAMSVTGSGGGGGGSAGIGGSPSIGSCQLGGVGGIGAHPGGVGGYCTQCGTDNDAAGTAGSVPGGGGGSDNSWVASDDGGNGANGQIIIVYNHAIIPVTATGNLIHNAASCGDTGEIAAHVTGIGLSYLWTPSGQTTDTATGLLAGTYSVAVTSACGGSASATVTITQPINVITATATPVTNVLCNGNNTGSATVSVSGGGSPFNYLWTPTNQTTQMASGLTAGIYTVIVNDFCLASTTTTVTITQPGAISLGLNATGNVLCNGGSNGSISSNVTNGTAPYGYSWSFGGITDTAVGLSVGTYTLTITDANGCTNSGGVTITQPNVLAATASVVRNVLCNGDHSGGASTSVNGGTTPYAYAWTGGQSSPTASGLTAGTYTVNITDANGCTTSTMTTVSQPAALQVLQQSTLDSGACTGSAWLVVSGGIYPYGYLWSNGNNTYSIHYVCHNSYCYTVTDKNGCIDSGCVSVPTDLGVASITHNAGKISVYPNPNNGQFTIQLSPGMGQWTVEVYNVLGEEVYTQKAINSVQSTINIGTQANGIYLYRVISSDNGNLLGEGKLEVTR